MDVTFPKRGVRRIFGPFREFGWWSGLLYTTDRLLRSLSPRFGLYVYDIIAQPVSDRDLLPAGLAKNLIFQPIGIGHQALSRMPAPDEIRQARFAQGASCLGVYRKDELLGFAWWCRHAYKEDEVRCTYVLDESEQAVFDFDVYVFPEHRLGIGFIAVWHGVNRVLRGEEVRVTCSRVTRFNVASGRLHAKLGARRLGSAIFLKLGGVQTMWSTFAPHFWLSLDSRKRAFLHLHPNRCNLLRQDIQSADGATSPEL